MDGKRWDRKSDISYITNNHLVRMEIMESFVVRYLAMWALAFLMMALLAISKIPS